MPVTCTITVTNPGRGDQPVLITERVPAGMDVVSVTPPDWAHVQDGELIIRGIVPARSSVTITVTAIVTGHGQLTNAVQARLDLEECRSRRISSCDPAAEAADTVRSRGRPSTVGTAFIVASAVRASGASSSTSATIPKVPKGVLLVNSETNQMLVYLSNGNGTFRRFRAYGTAETPLDVKVGDFNGDGKTDAVVANALSDNLTVYLGNGDGTFGRGREIALLGSRPVSIAVADFDRDNVLDLAVAQQGSADVAILLGRGDGTFRPLVNVPLLRGRPSSISTADWNGDGFADLIVTAIESNEVVFFRGDGRGRFSEAGRWEVGDYPVALAVDDFDLDGQVDVAVANMLSDSVTLLLSRGKSHNLGFTRVDVESVERPMSVISGVFFNRTIGLAVSNVTGNTVTFIGFEDGKPRRVKRFRVISEPVSLGLGDFNDDGLLDVVVAGLPVGSLATLVGRDDGTFALKR
jgi:hypothetical protein